MIEALMICIKGRIMLNSLDDPDAVYKESHSYMYSQTTCTGMGVCMCAYRSTKCRVAVW